jgi:predicted phage tail protein
MKKIQLLCVCVSLSLANSVSSFAQLLISGKDVEEALNSTAILQLDSTEKGFLMPRMTNVQRRMIAKPVKGLQVYVTDFNSEEGTIMFYDDKKWKVFTQLSSRPDPPTEVTVSSDSDIGQAIITFKTPEEDGGSPITSYTATSNKDGKTGTTTTVDSSGEGSIQINGLSSGNHAFEVTATNAIGSSEMGTSSTINIVGLNSPDPPTNVIVSLSLVAGQVIITFKAPVNNGGSPITHYAVNLSSEASSGETHNPIPANTLQEDQSGNLIIEFNDLFNGSYTFKVNAINAIGPSTWSTPSNTIIIIN